MTNKKFGVMFKCRCMSAERTLMVRHRRDGEDIREWFHDVQRALTREHQRISPLCLAITLEYAKFEIPENAPFIGGVPLLNS